MENWVLAKTGFAEGDAAADGNRFLCANGYMGLRGTEEESGSGQFAAVTLAGVYDRYMDRWREPVNAPHGLTVRMAFDGKPLRAAGALDVVVCDSEGLAVPGYAFPLEIRYQDGSAYRVQSDVNGHYYAEYILPGTYTLSMPPFEGFIPAESVSCTVTEKADSVVVENIGRFAESDEPSLEEESGGSAHGALTEIEGLAAALPPDGDGEYHYRYSVGENGFLLYADGTESDVLPVEERGDLAYGVRMVTVYHLPDGTDVDPASRRYGRAAGGHPRGCRALDRLLYR